MNDKFWEYKKLDELDDQEWESLCDNCGRCCLHKLEDQDTLELHYTQVICRLYDIECNQCSDYENRYKHVPDCISLRKDLEKTRHWLPPTCAYRLLAEEKKLPDWHPLISGDNFSVINAGMAIHQIAIKEEDADELIHHIIELI